MHTLIIGYSLTILPTNQIPSPNVYSENNNLIFGVNPEIQSWQVAPVRIRVIFPLVFWYIQTLWSYNPSLYRPSPKHVPFSWVFPKRSCETTKQQQKMLFSHTPRDKRPRPRVNGFSFCIVHYAYQLFYSLSVLILKNYSKSDHPIPEPHQGPCESLAAGAGHGRVGTGLRVT